MIRSLGIFAKAALFGAALIFVLSSVVISQKAKKPPTSLPKVTQIDFEGLKKTLKPNGKPLLVNFWATWCDPCREEFPELVKLQNAYRDKIDIATISIDDLAEIKTSVPKFLGEMKSDSPAYLLKTTDDDAAIRYVSERWSGNLPLTIIYSADGKQAYFKNSKFKYEDLVQTVEALLKP